MTRPRDDELVPIDEVARRVGLRASAIRYYEQRGLVEPAARSAGRRWYRPADIRRLAAIRFWQKSALISLEDIGELLADRPHPDWKQAVEARMQALQAKADRLLAARDLLAHILDSHDGSPPDGCPVYEALLWTTDAPADHRHPLPSEN